MSFLKQLDSFCEDRNTAEVATMSKLSLTGLQPCFEDTVLVLPVFVSMILLGIYRVHQCWVAGKYIPSRQQRLISLIQTLLCVGGFLLQLLTLIKLENPARYETVVYPFGVAAWFFIALTNIFEQFCFSYYGQWVNRFCYLWIVVVWTLRWPTQSAMADAVGSEWKFDYYVAAWGCQVALTAIMYVSGFVGIDDVRSQQPELVAVVGGDLELSDLKVELTSGTPLSEKLEQQRSSTSEWAKRLARSAKEEEKEMESVPWTEAKNPGGHANFFQRLTFGWLSPFVAHARKNTIEPVDVWDIRAQFRAIDNFNMFEEIWLKEKTRHESIADPVEKEKNRPLRNAIWTAFGRYHLVGAPLLLVQNCSQLVLPLLLKPLLNFVTPGNMEPLQNGYYYSGGFFIALMVMTTTENQYFCRVMNTGIRIRSALVPTIFRHSLRLSNQSRQERSVGAIVSHMSSDTDKIQTLAQSLHNLWSAPLRLLLALAMLVQSLGVSGFGGFLCVVCLIPIQAQVMKTMVRINKEVMGKSDARIRICSEVLTSMRVIKFYAWEQPFRERIEALRKIELNKLNDVVFWRALNSFFVSANPIVMSCGTFVAYALVEGNLTAGSAFQALTLFGQMIYPLMMLPNAISAYMDTMASVDRIESFLLAKQVEEPYTEEGARAAGVIDEKGLPVPSKDGTGVFTRVKDGISQIYVENGTYSWNGKDAAAVVDINLKIEPGSLTAIIGSTGSGKSSLISALIGEMQMKFGRAKFGGSFAYAPQQAWIYNATVRENILFGLEYDEKRYNAAIDGACLRKDIEHQFKAGDQTELGEKGINMSGGQRQRLNIARALYANADTLIFDDPLSALDPHVGSEVFNNIKAITNKTRICSCNQLHLASHFDRIIVLSEGKIIEDGTFAELHGQTGSEFHRLYQELGNVPEEKIADKKPEAKVSVVKSEVNQSSIEPSQSVRQRKKSIKAESVKDQSEEQKKEAGKLVKEEGHSVGSVKYEVYAGYFSAIGMRATVAIFLGNIISKGCNLGSAQWLASWASNSGKPGAQSAGFYVGIYSAIAFSQVIAQYCTSRLAFGGSVLASSRMHGDFIKGLMMSPISFFDSTPGGRITNRMSKDMGVIDNMLMMMLQMFISSLTGLLSMLVIISINTTYVLAAFVPILMIFGALQNYYRSTAVQLKRLDAVTRSPIYAHFSECLNGMATIRAYGAQDRMSVVNSARLDLNVKTFFLTNMSNRWLSMRLEFLGGLLILATGINVTIQKGSIEPSVAGVSMSYALQITATLNMLVRVFTEVEGMFNAVERVQEYINLEPEAAHDGPETPPNWPDKGEIAINDLVMSYVPGTPPVLRGLTVQIKPAEKVGVVGRTGAGKSSLFQALFRMMEPTSGSMKFDGIDLAGLGLDAVRLALSIIPQEPVLFSGTLRFNLDPFDSYSDMNLWAALDKASLKNLLVARGQGLDMEVTDGGENFSVGQRQLVCLARALLRKSKILVLDEATANVDLETDALIQKTIRENFADRTTLTIAHRLNTIIDCDKILVLELGKVLEFDSPRNLLSNMDSEFSAMVRDTGPENEKTLREAVMGDASVAAAREKEAEFMCAQAQQRLASSVVAWGPLMSSYRDASELMRAAWDEHAQPKWEQELNSSGVALDAWMEKMMQLLKDVNGAARCALEQEHIPYTMFSYDQVSGTGEEVRSYK